VSVTAGAGARRKAMCRAERKQARAGSRNGTQESTCFNKNIKKLGSLIMGVRGLKTGPNSCPYSSFIVLLVIRNIPLYLMIS
jgi:hypothetical protein